MSNRKKTVRERTKQLTRVERPKSVKKYIRAVASVNKYEEEK